MRLYYQILIVWGGLHDQCRGQWLDDLRSKSIVDAQKLLVVFYQVVADVWLGLFGSINVARKVDKKAGKFQVSRGSFRTPETEKLLNLRRLLGLFQELLSFIKRFSQGFLRGLPSASLSHVWRAPAFDLIKASNARSIPRNQIHIQMRRGDSLLMEGRVIGQTEGRLDKHRRRGILQPPLLEVTLQ